MKRNRIIILITVFLVNFFIEAKSQFEGKLKLQKFYGTKIAEEDTDNKINKKFKVEVKVIGMGKDYKTALNNGCQNAIIKAIALYNRKVSLKKVLKDKIVSIPKTVVLKRDVSQDGFVKVWLKVTVEIRESRGVNIRKKILKALQKTISKITLQDVFKITYGVGVIIAWCSGVPDVHLSFKILLPMIFAVYNVFVNFIKEYASDNKVAQWLPEIPPELEELIIKISKELENTGIDRNTLRELIPEIGCELDEIYKQKNPSIKLNDKIIKELLNDYKKKLEKEKQSGWFRIPFFTKKDDKLEKKLKIINWLINNYDNLKILAKMLINFIEKKEE